MAIKGSNRPMVEKITIESKVEENDTHYPWDLPQYNKISRFLSSLEEAKIETTKCNRCGKIQWPPRSICASCLSMDLVWTELPRKGKIVSFGKAYVGNVQEEEPPIIVAALELDGGLRLLTRLINSKYENLQVGMAVKLARTALLHGKPYWAFEPDLPTITS